MKNLILFMLFINLSLYADNITCNYSDSMFSKDLINYKIRINHFIKNNPSTNCNILFAYNKLIDVEEKMNQFENEPETFMKFANTIINYPNISYFLDDIETFKLIENYNLDSIEKVLKKLNLSKNKNNFIYIMTALYFENKEIYEKSFYENIKTLQKKISSSNLKYFSLFFKEYVEYYDGDNNSTHFKTFINILDKITIETIKDYSIYSDYFQYFFPNNLNNMEYINVANNILNNKYLNQKLKLGFLTELSGEINYAIENSVSSNEINSYLNYLLNDKTLIRNFHMLTCTFNNEHRNSTKNTLEQPEINIITNELGKKIKFQEENKDISNEILNSMGNKSFEEKLITLSYLNYITKIYFELENNKEKDIFINLLTKTSEDLTFNMRTITVLYDYTSYFNDLFNNNWKNDAFIDILFIKHNNYSIIDHLKNNNEDSVRKIQSMVYKLARTKEDNLNDITFEEVKELVIVVGTQAFEVIDTASYATIIIPGAGIAVHTSRVLAKQSLKQIAKRSVKKNATMALRHIKNSGKDFFNDSVKYGDRRTKKVKNINNNIKKADNADAVFQIGKYVAPIIFSYFDIEINSQEKDLCTTTKGNYYEKKK